MMNDNDVCKKERIWTSLSWYKSGARHFENGNKPCVPIMDHVWSTACLLLLWRYNSGSLGLLNNILPFKTILDLSCPFYKFHLFQVIPDVIFPSGLGPSYWSPCDWFPFVYFPYSTNFRHSIYVFKPAQSLGFNILYYVPYYCMWNPKFLCEFCVILKKMCVAEVGMFMRSFVTRNKK
jgi:hypothetical protein